MNFVGLPGMNKEICKLDIEYSNIDNTFERDRLSVVWEGDRWIQCITNDYWDETGFRYPLFYAGAESIVHYYACEDVKCDLIMNKRYYSPSAVAEIPPSAFRNTGPGKSTRLSASFSQAVLWVTREGKYFKTEYLAERTNEGHWICGSRDDPNSNHWKLHHQYPTDKELRDWVNQECEYLVYGELPDAEPAISLFISHAHKDRERFVRRFAKKLTDNGFKIWIDEKDLLTGDILWQRIEEAISNCDFAIIVLSENSIISSGVSQELRMAQIENLQRTKIIPILIDQLDESLLPHFLRIIHYTQFIDYRNPRVWRKKIDRLTKDIVAQYSKRIDRV
jgi:hypothetical protein